MTQKLALVGFGTVGRGLAEILGGKRDLLRERYGYDSRIVAVTDQYHGSCCSPEGLDPGQLLQLVADGRPLDDYPGAGSGWDSLETIRSSGADVVAEVTLTDIKTGEPAREYCRTAIESGCHVVTTNKGPVALAWRELSELARSRGVEFRFEGTVMSGTPVLATATETLAGCDVARIRGILNGTTNYILSEMELGRPYAEALATAQELGYAEADPTADVEGHDVLAKVVILANVVLGAEIGIGDVSCEGITGLDADAVAAAPRAGKRWKLIGQVERRDGLVSASVAPLELPLDDPLAAVGGVTNAITLETDLVGPITIVGAGAGREATGFALLSDLLAIHRRHGER